MEPTVRAVLHQRPDFDFKGLDLITDRYALACLLEAALNDADQQSAVSPPTWKKDDWTGEFSVGAQIVGDTILFVREDKVTLQPITEFRGYRHDFRAKYYPYDRGL